MLTVADAWPALALLGIVLMLPWAASWVKRRGWEDSPPGLNLCMWFPYWQWGRNKKWLRWHWIWGLTKSGWYWALRHNL